MLKISKLTVMSTDIRFLDIFWEIKDTFEDVNNYSFKVERSPAQYGPYEAITGEFRSKFTLRDVCPPGSKSFYHRLYYRIVVKDVASLEETTYPSDGTGVCLAAPANLIALEKARLRRLKLQVAGGRKVWILFPKKSGQVCSCVDKVRGRSLITDCLSCYDTGFVGGFYTPVQTYAMITSPQETETLSLVGAVEAEDTIGEFSNFPELTQDAIIIEAENVRWRVGARITKYKEARSLLWQQAYLHRIAETDVIFNIPTPADKEDILSASEGRNFTNPHNLENL